MIKITIEKVSTEEYRETQNFLIKKTPTEQRKHSSYGGTEEVVFMEENEPREVVRRREVTRTLLAQEIDRDEDFDFAGVVKAINRL